MDRKLLPPAVALVAILLLVPLTGCTVNEVDPMEPDEPGPDAITMTVSAPDVHKVTREAGEVWDATMDIVAIEPDTARVKWIELSITVKTWDGSLALPATQPSKDSGLYGTSPEVWYQEGSGDEELATAGDVIRITSMDQTFEGGQVLLVRAGEVLATADLPDVFW